MSFDDPGHGWPNRPTWALVCWLHAYRYSYLMDVSLACWRAGECAFDRSGLARREMAAKLRRDVAANVTKIDSLNFDRPLAELLGRIDFEAIADHWLARFSGYRRRARQADL
jgi:hypothetical protein